MSDQDKDKDITKWISPFDDAAVREAITKWISDRASEHLASADAAPDRRWATHDAWERCYLAAYGAANDFGLGVSDAREWAAAWADDHIATTAHAAACRWCGATGGLRLVTLDPDITGPPARPFWCCQQCRRRIAKSLANTASPEMQSPWADDGGHLMPHQREVL
ncbi:MAG: hypothetical protein OXT70_01100 [Chloroflexota bacterium]|nr:hypothetical protein [Chloroflexota bacterium]